MVVMGSASVPVYTEHQSILWLCKTGATSELKSQNGASVKSLLSSALSVPEEPRQENSCQGLDDGP